MSSFHPSNGIFLFEDWKLPICVAFRFGLARDFKWNQQIAPYICLHLIICPHQEFRVGKCLPWRIVIMLFHRWVRKAPDRFSEIHYDQNPFARGAKVWNNFLKKWVRTLVIDQNVPINVYMQHGRKISKQGYLKSIGHCRADWLAPSSVMYIYILMVRDNMKESMAHCNIFCYLNHFTTTTFAAGSSAAWLLLQSRSVATSISRLSRTYGGCRCCYRHLLSIDLWLRAWVRICERQVRRKLNVSVMLFLFLLLLQSERKMLTVFRNGHWMLLLFKIAVAITAAAAVVCCGATMLP